VIPGNKVSINASEIAPLGTKDWDLEKVLLENHNFTENDRAVIVSK
jgi:hypothetical protein